MLAILVLSKEEEEGKAVLEQFCGLIEKHFQAESAPYIIGPAQAAISKINDWYRYTLYLKHADYEKLVQIKDILKRYSK